MEPDKFKNLCTNTFESLFVKAEESDKRQYLTSFFAFYKLSDKWILDFITNYVFGEILDILNTFKIFQDSTEVDKKIKTRARMLMYCHIVEAELIYMVIFNMIRTIKKLEYSPIINVSTKSNKIQELEYAYKKVKEIVKEGSALGLQFDSMYSEIYFNQLRNAFSHSQYFLDKDGDLIISRNISPTTSRIFKKSSQKTHYKYEEIEEIFNKTLVYVDTFIGTYKKFLLEFKDGTSNPIIFGNMRFDKSTGRWLF